jgi:Cft2 family RNA processing exonuclease
MSTPSGDYPDSTADHALGACGPSSNNEGAVGASASSPAIVRGTKRRSTLKVKFHGALGTVTGSAHFLHHVPSDRWLAIDCGLLQEKTKLKGNTPAELPVPLAKLACLFLTHAHLDHIGMLPCWIDAGFAGQIWCTRPTAELTIIALEEIVRRSTVPLVHDVKYYADYIRQRLVCPDDRNGFRFGSAHEVLPDLDVALFPTAHVVGSVAFRFRAVSKYHSTGEIGFLGDIGPIEDDSHGGLMPPRSLPPRLPRTVVCESTYGDRSESTEKPKDFASRQSALAGALRAALGRDERATALIPVFTMQRTTDVLLDLMALLREQGPALGLQADEEVEVSIPSEGAQAYAKVLLTAYERVLPSGLRPWYNPSNLLLGGPAKTPEDVARQLRSLRSMLAPEEGVSPEVTKDGVRLRLTWGAPPRSLARLKIILCSSGSTTFGQAHRLIYRHLENPAASLILAGFVPEDSIGGRLKRMLDSDETTTHLKIPVPDEDGAHEEWPVRRVALAVHNLSAWYSGHASKGSLLRLLRGTLQPGHHVSPLSVMLVHGRPPARLAMVRALKETAGQESWAHRIQHAHFPTQLSPEYDAGVHLFESRGMEEVRTRSIIRWDTQGRSVESLAFGRLRRLLKDRLGWLTPDLRSHGQILAIARNDQPWCRHQIMIKPVAEDSAAVEIVVESDVGGCESDEFFRGRLFVWKELMALARNGVDRKPLYCGDHLTLQSLQDSLEQRKKAVVLFSYGSADQRAAENLSMFMAGDEIDVVVLAPEYVPVLEALGYQVGPWIANAVIPGLDQSIPFTADDYFGIAPVLVNVMNKAIPAQPFSLEVMNYGVRPN